MVGASVKVGGIGFDSGMNKPEACFGVGEEGIHSVGKVYERVRVKVKRRREECNLVRHKGRDVCQGVRRGELRRFKRLIEEKRMDRAVEVYRGLSKDEVGGIFECMVGEDMEHSLSVGRLLCMSGDEVLGLRYYRRYVEGGGDPKWDRMRDEASYFYVNGRGELGLKLCDFIFRRKGGVEEGVIRFVEKTFGQRDVLGVEYVLWAEVEDAEELYERCVWLIECGHGERVNAYVLKNLDEWIENKSEEALRQNIRGLVDLAVIVNSRGHFQRLIEKTCGGDLACSLLKKIVRGSPARIDFLRNIKLIKGKRDETVEESLLNRVYIDQDLVVPGLVSMKDMEVKVSGWIYHLKQRGGILEDILLAMCRYVERDPRFTIDLYTVTEGQLWAQRGEYVRGNCDYRYRRVGITVSVFEKIFGATLMHELVHMLMNVLYSNGGDPFCRECQGVRKEKLEGAYKKVEAMLVQVGGEEGLELRRTRDILNDVGSSLQYENEDKYSEYVARYAEILAMGYEDDPTVRDLVKPLRDYWEEYIVPDIKGYLEQVRGEK